MYRTRETAIIVSGKTMGGARQSFDRTLYAKGLRELGMEYKVERVECRPLINEVKWLEIDTPILWKDCGERLTLYVSRGL